MNRPKLLRGWVGWAGALAWLAAASVASRGEEAAQAFLEGLRQRDYHDMALAYLEQMRTSPRCPSEFREVIDYEAGVTLVALARTGTIPTREARLDQARDRLSQFVKEHPGHALAAAANTQLANVLVERGRIKSELAGGSSKSPDQKKALLAEARTHYEAARKVFETARQYYYDRAKRLRETTDPQAVPELEQARKEAYRDYLQARLFLAGVVYEIGKTYPPASKEYRDRLTEAAGQYGEIYERYGTKAGGLYARMWEGRVYKELGDYQKAIKVFREMLTLPEEEPAFRRLMTQSLELALETYLLPEVKNYTDAVELFTQWESNARPDELSSAEGLNVVYLGGLAYRELAKSLEKGKEQRASRAAARSRLEQVARSGSPHRRDAMEALQDPFFGEVEEVTDEALTYLDAKDKGDFAWGKFVVVMGKLQAARTAEEKEGLSAQMAEARDEAIKYYRMALDLAGEEVPVEDLNRLRLNLTYLYFFAEDFYRAAVLGEFLARRQPASSGARKGAEIAVKAYRSVYTRSGPQEDRSFAVRWMEGIARYVTTRWQGEPEADEAWMMLADTAVDERDLEKAIEYLGNISEKSPRRGQAELRTGQALWAAYVRGSSKPEGSRPPQTALDEMLQKAQDLLEKGISRLQTAVKDGTPVETSLVQSELSLAQIHVGAGRAAEAVAVLDDPEIGPVTLLGADAPATRHGTLAQDIYKTALRAYVGAEKLDRAEEVMNSLEKGAADSRSLTRIYIALGRELQQQLERLGKEGKESERQKVSEGFEVFLERIRTRQQGNNFTSLNWVAETYVGLGDGLAAGRSELPEEAVNDYTKAAATYATIIKRIREKDTELNAPDGAADTITVRLAACLRKLGQYDKAMQLLVRILRKREKRVDVQIEAARTYQAWGEERPGYYQFAILGGHEEERRNLVWGWAQIANRVYPFPQYQDIFHEARYNLALCRMKLALSKKTDTDRKATLKQAELDVTRIFQIDPKMGGEKWYDQYDELLKSIQKLLGKRATGLKGLEESE